MIDVVDIWDTIHAPIGVVWDACTSSAKFQRWFRTAKVESTFEEGASITFTATVGDKLIHDRGTILAVSRERLLQFDHHSELSPGHPTLVTFRFEPRDTSTLINIRHENFHVDEAFKHARFFWTMALYDLKEILAPTA